jgi:hypothetical protein
MQILTEKVHGHMHWVAEALITMHLTGAYLLFTEKGAERFA